MRFLLSILAFLGMIGAAMAQPVQQPDPAFLQKAIGALQNQRNAALDGQAVCEARSSSQAEQVAALTAERDKLKAELAKLQPVKAPVPPK